jgi:uncharacterized beta-barrel protein YwiB (DUF1934 family)
MQVLEKSTSISFKSVLSAAKKLSDEEKYLLHKELYSKNALSAIKGFEQTLKQTKKVVLKTDDEIVKIIKKNRNVKPSNAL